MIYILQMVHDMVALPATGEGTIKAYKWARCYNPTRPTRRERHLATYLSTDGKQKGINKAYLAPFGRMKRIMGPLCFPGHHAAISLE